MFVIMYIAQPKGTFLSKFTVKSLGLLYKHTINIRVRYAETDKMGYVYYGNYATYFELGRVEMLRSLGVSYRKMEDEGIMLPVVNLNVNYKRPAFYDDELTLRTTINQLPTAKIIFNYELRRGEEVLTTAETTLVFLSQKSGRPERCPEAILQALASSF